jgi:hypothetical protein
MFMSVGDIISHLLYRYPERTLEQNGNGTEQTAINLAHGRK